MSNNFIAGEYTCVCFLPTSHACISLLRSLSLSLPLSQSHTLSHTHSHTLIYIRSFSLTEMLRSSVPGQPGLLRRPSLHEMQNGNRGETNVKTIDETQSSSLMPSTLSTCAAMSSATDVQGMRKIDAQAGEEPSSPIPQSPISPNALGGRLLPPSQTSAIHASAVSPAYVSPPNYYPSTAPPAQAYHSLDRERGTRLYMPFICVIGGKMRRYHFILCDEPAYLSWDAPNARKSSTKLLATQLVRVVRGQAGPGFAKLPNARDYKSVSLSVVFRDRHWVR